MARRAKTTAIEIIDAPSHPVQQAGGGLQGAERLSRETMNWAPNMRSPDAMINPVKPMADARSRDMTLNDGYAMGAVQTNKDSIVGSHYRLNAQPNLKILGTGASDAWSEEFQEVVEERFELLAESDGNYFDAAASNNFTGLIRLAVASFCITGEVLGTAEWIRDNSRPINTAIQLISPDRMSNPDLGPDTKLLRRGVLHDFYGRPTGGYIRKTYPSDAYNYQDLNTWDFVPIRKPWGRLQLLHIIEQLLPDQTRGVSDMVSVLKQMRMTKNFQDITLQNAVINASYAASIESELPPTLIAEQMGKGQTFLDLMGGYMTAMSQFLDGGKNIHVDGAKIPTLFPGTKLNMRPMGTPGGVGTGYEESLQRNICAALGISYEEYSKDYSKVSYSSARASMLGTWKAMTSKKKAVADRFASMIYTLWLEEEIAAGNIPLPPGMRRSDFYKPLMKEAFCQANWVGAGRGQIDELKETQAAVMRVKSGFSTYEEEIAKMGRDWRKVFKQRAREEGLIKQLGLTFSLDATQAGANDAKNTLSDNKPSTPANDNED